MSQRENFFRFCVVGVIGFVTDAGLLTLLMKNGMSHYTARVVSFPAAVLVTWWLNRLWSFTEADRSRAGQQIMRYFLVQILGAAANFAVYLTVLTVIEPTPVNAVLALAVGAMAGLIINYFGSRILVFQTS